MTRSLSLAHLTFLHLSPRKLIHLAANSGFDAVGLRLTAVNDTTPSYPLMDDPGMMADTLGALLDTGIRVSDIEFVRLTPDFNPSAMAPFLEAGAKLGARYIVTAPYDTNLDRLSQNLARFAEIAAAYHLSPVLEFFPWTTVPNLSSALKIVDKTARDDISVLLDTLHFDRSDSSLKDIVGAPASRFPFLHLCDAEVPPIYGERAAAHCPRGTLDTG
ncbi:TIM barrel protein [Phaeobacter gallaeciensis]|uniref:sugar phosphate isomerase/epimerase family protein n=1 Tax=Phaeobacter gallaeciensis TaxID=60890 RepID=UPI00237F9C35|nr:TIM barrel protein [Phaeobacter gallaeciensis]MDE4193460.1 TIM barrel protein [Phaeobacter gallaeciensis]MDE4201809.1 TIM barrel protein [Phaeobacter gallaeciensis]MDE4205906.1 TIM barrel protein [Phaeobacter gallaeciensis]MDE4210103.1 TIM barrel protein [Phaeobacter gallaeciensis]MDE4218466.1 TIM barrel protein [Phaeobacter gallaeciensis]